jgi:hypothetical protein
MAEVVLNAFASSTEYVTYSASHEGLAGLDVAGEFALVGNSVGILRHFGVIWIGICSLEK